MYVKSIKNIDEKKKCSDCKKVCKFGKRSCLRYTGELSIPVVLADKA